MPTPLSIRTLSGILLGLSGLLVTTAAIGLWDLPVPAVRASSDPTLDDPDHVCASCHRAVYDEYRKTSMSRGSGAATSGLIPGSFSHTSSAVDYKVLLRDREAIMSFSRTAPNPKGQLSGEHRLELFVGSGHRGRTYLYNESGLWFELPINFYTRRNAWAMAPAFDNAAHMPAPLPVDPNCLHCHASELQPVLPDARNHYASFPFRQGGIGCNSCHGDPTQHLAQNGRGPILNPSKLSPTRRDSTCIQCHLEGDAVVYRPGKSLASFSPGDDLSETAVYFVRAVQQGEGVRATSQYEALLRAACKRAAGDRLTCTTCHDPHSSPAPEQRVTYYRKRCLACHAAPAMATHHPEQQDCAACHMPSRSTSDISHEQVTDHDIEAHPADPQALHFLLSSDDVQLVPVGSPVVGDRELGLAYAQLAARGNRAAGRTALSLLTRAAPLYPRDPELNSRLGYLQQIEGESLHARASYIAALEANPLEPAALANLAVLDAASNRVNEGVRLLERLTDADPSQTSAGLNLAFIQCRLNHLAEARELLDRLTRLNPDDPALRLFRTTGSYGGQHCDLHPLPGAP